MNPDVAFGPFDKNDGPNVWAVESTLNELYALGGVTGVMTPLNPWQYALAVLAPGVPGAQSDRAAIDARFDVLAPVRSGYNRPAVVNQMKAFVEAGRTAPTGSSIGKVDL